MTSKRQDKDMPAEIDFSGGERGKFYRKDVNLRFPTVAEDILRQVELNPGLTDAKLADALADRGLSPKSVTQAVRQLASQGELVRDKPADGITGNRLPGKTPVPAGSVVGQLDLPALMEQLRRQDALREEDGLETGEVDRIEPQRAGQWPVQVEPKIVQALQRMGIQQPYQHQAEAIEKSLSGADVVMESPTASGKTLSFAVPMLQALLQDRAAHGLMIYPMKALAFDQRSQIKKLCSPLGVDSWPYDGDTDKEHKALLKQKPPPILLTNPEYLNLSFLAHSDKWQSFLQRLQFIVIDEMHEYRGFFGGNMALLLRRFLLCLNRLDVHPRLFLCTATCANPQEHARNLTGREVQVVSARGIFRPKRHFVFVKPQIPDFKYRDILRLRVENAAIAVLERGLSALVFCPTKNFLEEAFQACQRRVEEQGMDKELISAYHADLPSDLRQKIQQRIQTGSVRVVFCTNALEMGLDIGGLDGIILAGFPPSIMSAWQQVGRTGRSWNKDAFVLFYAMNDPIDRFFVSNLKSFLDKPLDELIVDPENPSLIESHLASLIEETGGKLLPEDAQTLGTSFYQHAVDSNSSPIGSKRFKPQTLLRLRGGIGHSFKLKSGNTEIGQVSGSRKFREAYLGAMFTVFGRKYRVQSHEEKAVVLVDTTEAERDLKTVPNFYATLQESSFFAGLEWMDFSAFHAALDVHMHFTGYKLVDERTDSEVDRRGGDEWHNENNLHAFILHCPAGDSRAEGVGAVEHMLRVGAMFVIPADRFDTSTYSKADEGSIYYYENYAGGIGVAKKLFQKWTAALRKGMEIADNCSCSKGCQNCIEPAKSYNMSNAAIDKVAGMALATKILEAEGQGPVKKYHQGSMVPVEPS